MAALLLLLYGILGKSQLELQVLYYYLLPLLLTGRLGHNILIYTRFLATQPQLLQSTLQ